MKLRNKKTGEIGYTAVLHSKAIVIMDENAIQLASYTSLAELNSEWKDYEEPKDRWYINENGGVLHYVPDGPEGEDLVYNKYQDEIGNHFDTREEAEKAVEKLKAWKRLKDKGFRFDRWNNVTAGPYMPIWFYFEEDTALEDVKSDLDLLFSGGEE
jgi:hypothetical protein